MQIRSFTKHPEVGGESKVGCDDVENLAPDGITGPDRAVEEDKVVPEEPRDITENQGEHKVLVHGDTATC